MTKRSNAELSAWLAEHAMGWERTNERWPADTWQIPFGQPGAARKYYMGPYQKGRLASLPWSPPTNLADAHALLLAWHDKAASAGHVEPPYIATLYIAGLWTVTIDDGGEEWISSGVTFMAAACEAVYKAEGGKW